MIAELQSTHRDLRQHEEDHADMMAELQSAHRERSEHFERADNFRTALIRSEEQERRFQVQLQQQTLAFHKERMGYQRETERREAALEEERTGCQLQLDRQDADLLEALEKGHRLEARLLEIELLEQKKETQWKGSSLKQLE